MESFIKESLRESFSILQAFDKDKPLIAEENQCKCNKFTRFFGYVFDSSYHKSLVRYIVSAVTLPMISPLAFTCEISEILFNRVFNKSSNIFSWSTINCFVPSIVMLFGFHRPLCLLENFLPRCFWCGKVRMEIDQDDDNYDSIDDYDQIFNQVETSQDVPPESSQDLRASGETYQDIPFESGETFQGQQERGETLQNVPLESGETSQLQRENVVEIESSQENDNEGCPDGIYQEVNNLPNFNLIRKTLIKVTMREIRHFQDEIRLGKTPAQLLDHYEAFIKKLDERYGFIEKFKKLPRADQRPPTGEHSPTGEHPPTGEHHPTDEHVQIGEYFPTGEYLPSGGSITIIRYRGVNYLNRKPPNFPRRV